MASRNVNSAVRLASTSIAARVAGMEYPKIFQTIARYAITPGGWAFGTAE